MFNYTFFKGCGMKGINNGMWNICVLVIFLTYVAWADERRGGDSDWRD